MRISDWSSDVCSSDLDHPWAIDADAAVDLARACAAAAFAADPRITGSAGAGVSSHRGISAYANTHGFFSARIGTRHSLRLAVIASAGTSEERRVWKECSSPGRFRGSPYIT